MSPQEGRPRTPRGVRVCTRAVVVIAWIALSLVGMSGCRDSGVGDSSGGNETLFERDAGQPEQSRGVLLDAVRVIDAERDAWVSQADGGRWTVPSERAQGISPGDVLLFEDVAVTVEEVDRSGGGVVLTVRDATLEEVFESLSIAQALSLRDATFEPDDPNEPDELDAALEPARESIEKGISGSAAVDKVLRISFRRSALSGNVALGLDGMVSFDFDADRDPVTRGRIDVGAKLSGTASVQLSKGASITLPEVRVGRIRVPVPYALVDRALRSLGVRIASIWIPVYLSTEAKASFALALRLDARAGIASSLAYESPRTFELSAEQTPSEIELSGELPGDAPDTAAQGEVEVGTYVRPKPQLLILNEVASVGTDVKVGLYGVGEATLRVDPPAFCLITRTELRLEASAFFKQLKSTFESDSYEDEWVVGEPTEYGGCPDDPEENAGGAGGMSSMTPGSGGAGGAPEMGADGGMIGGAGGATGGVGGGGGGSGGTTGVGQRPPAPPRYHGVSQGDPHILTLDGTFYGMQGAGEFTFARDERDGFEVQIRTYARSTLSVHNTWLSTTSAVATQVGGDRVVMHYGDEPWVNGEVVTWESDRIDLPGGGRLYRVGGRRVLVWPDNTQLHAYKRGPRLDVGLYVNEDRKGYLDGVLGHFDGARNNGELRMRSGEILPARPEFVTFYRVYVESWRIRQEDSLFDYADGEDTETFTNRDFPPGLTTVDSLTAQERSDATAICEDAGAPNEWMDACVLDVGATGDSSFAEGLGDLPIPEEVVDVKSPPATTVGTITLSPAPASVVEGATASNAHIVLFAEREGETLQQDVGFDAHVPGAYTNALVSPGVVTAGHAVDSYFLHFDPQSGTVARSGTITFARPIIGVIASTALLEQSDSVLGAPGVAYPAPGSEAAREYELGSDSFEISADRMSLTVDFRTSTSVDQMRVLTVAEGESLPTLLFGITEIAPPDSLVEGDLEATGVAMFAEQAVVLEADMPVSLSQPGAYGVGAFSSGVVPAGTSVQSYYLHFDPPGTATVNAEASVYFPGEIVGVQATNNALEAGAVALGAPATVYISNSALESPDAVRIGTDRRGLALRLAASTGTDGVRVLVLQ